MRRKGVGRLAAAAVLLGCGSERLRVAVGDSIDDARRVFAQAGLKVQDPGPPLFPSVACDDFDAYSIGDDGMVLVYFMDGVIGSIEEERVGRGSRTMSEVLLSHAR